MQPLSQNNIRLKSFSFKEELEGRPEVDVSNIELEGFDLLIGDNAQGKTRLLRTLQFITELIRGNRKRLATLFTANFTFIPQLNSENEELSYEINISPTNEGNNYIEKITNNGIVVFSTTENILMNEENNQNIANFFVPANIPAIAAIKDDSRFSTMTLIRDFFARVLFIAPNRGQVLDVDVSPRNTLILNPDGSNLTTIMSNWSKNKPHIYQELINDFKRCFPIIEEVKIVPQVVSPGIKTDFLAIHEKDVPKDILQLQWSEGIWRLLCLLCLPKIQFEHGEKILLPSMICIDEIENSLDFKTLGFVTKYLKDYSDQIQIIMSSHSPIMSEFIHPKNWQIVKRRGTKIQISKPDLVESNLDEQLSFFRGKYWDFYTKHVSSSDLYEPK